MESPIDWGKVMESAPRPKQRTAELMMNLVGHSSRHFLLEYALASVLHSG
jgi:hypothetical protein